MAITVNQQPTSTFSLTYNRMDVQCESTNVSEPSFSFIFVLKDVRSGATISTQKVAPHPTYEYGVFDISTVLDAYLSYDIDFNAVDYSVAGNSLIEYEVEIGEEYEVAGVLTEFPNLTSFTGFAINGGLKLDDWLSFDPTDYIPTSGGDALFLTTQPRPVSIKENQNAFLYAYSEASTDAFFIFIETYDENDVLIGEFYFENTDDDSVIYFPSGYNLNDATSIIVSSGATPVLDSDVAYYDIQLITNGFIASSEKIRYNIQRPASCYNPITLHFLNELGGFDSFCFDMKNLETVNRQTNRYKAGERIYDSVGNGGVSYSTERFQGRRHYTQTNQMLKLSSDWITPEQKVWLEQLFSSPVIIAEWNGNRYAIEGIEEQSFTLEKRFNRKIFNLEFNIKLSYDNYRQRW